MTGIGVNIPGVGNMPLRYAAINQEQAQRDQQNAQAQQEQFNTQQLELETQRQQTQEFIEGLPSYVFQDPTVANFVQVFYSHGTVITDQMVNYIQNLIENWKANNGIIIHPNQIGNQQQIQTDPNFNWNAAYQNFLQQQNQPQQFVVPQPGQFVLPNNFGQNNF